MTIAIQNSIISWTSAIVCDPASEAIERVSRCFQGINFSHIDHPKYNWHERAVLLLSALVLIIPILGSITWICMRTLGVQSLSQPERDVPFQPWQEAILIGQEPVIRGIADVPPLEGTAPVQIRELRFKNKVDDRPLYESHTRIETRPEANIVTSQSPYESSKSLFDTNWVLQSMKFKSESKNTDVRMEKIGNAIQVNGLILGKAVDHEFVLEDPSIPWIQHPRGLHPFIFSDETELTCCGVDPTSFPPKLRTAKWSKEGHETLKQYGTMLKLEMCVQSLPWPLSAKTLVQSWFHPETAEMVRQDIYFPFMIDSSSKLIESR